jgi:hypothetical protein
MFHKKMLAAAAVSLTLGLGAASQAAAQTIIDGWTLVSPGTAGTVEDIGRLNLVSGTATVEQEVGGGGNVFVGARFEESGSIFSISYTPENTVGAGDVGAPVGLNETLTISFTDVMGVVTSLLGGGGFEYNFTSGSFSLSGSAGLYATGSIIGIGGSAAATQIIGGVNGDSTILAQILNTFLGLDILNGAGISLLPQLATGEVLFQVVTNNNVTSLLGGPGACSFDAAAICQSFSVASAGDAYLTETLLVPEPGALSLAALGLLSIGMASRRRKQAGRIAG